MAREDSAQAKRWTQDVIAFGEQALQIERPDTGRLGPLVLEQHQKAWLREATRRGPDGRFAHKIVVASWPKRDGKTMCVAVLGAWRMCCFRRQRVGILANSERQAVSNVFEELAGFMRSSPALRGMVPEREFQGSQLRVPSLGNAVRCYPANWRTVQGTAFDLLCCDELHAAEDKGRAYQYAAQQTEARDAQVAIASQAGAPVDGNPLWRMHQAQDPSIYFDYRQDLGTPWARARAQAAQAELLPGEYDLLWRNSWGATGQKLLRPDDVTAAAWDYEPPRSETEWEALRKAWGFEHVPYTIACGLDRAGVGPSGDRTVWTVVAMFEPSPEAAPVYAVVGMDVLPTGGETEVLQVDQQTRRIFGNPVGVALEAYGCSDLVTKIKGAMLRWPTPQQQQILFGRLYRAFREHRIRYPAGAGFDQQRGVGGLLQAELIALEYDTATGAGITRFGTQSGHDDCVYSLAWSAEAAGGEVRAPIFVQDFADQLPPRPAPTDGRRVLEEMWDRED